MCWLFSTPISCYIFTARIQRIREGNIFSLFTPVEGGIPSQVQMEGYPSQVWMGRYPIPGRSGWRGYPIPSLNGADTSSQVQIGGAPSQVWMGGAPHPRSGWSTLGYPHQGLDGVPLSRRQISIASTCYAAGSMPLVFTQDDFLGQRIFQVKLHVQNYEKSL